MIDAGVRQQIARELFDGELVEGQVAVERVHHPVAVFPDLAGRVDGVAVGVGVTRDVEPRARPALTEVGRSEEAVDRALGVGGVERALDAALRRDYAAPAPRLALLALNPHAGDGGRIGTDEQTWLLEALNAARHEGLDVRGPFAADGFFAWRGYRDVDATLALYHDQGLIPFKMLAVHDGVNATAGLDLVRTSPDHGTAWDLAGQGRADAGSMLAALHTAVEVVKNRRAMR